MFTPDAQKAMSATCKSCHARFVAQVEVVTIVRLEDYALVLKRMWPRLRMVILQDKNTFCSVAHPSKIFHVYVENEGNKRTTVTLLRPLQGLATDLPWTRLAAQQLAHQLQLRWPSMPMFMMSFVHDLGDLATEVVTQLVKTTLTDLVQLYLFECELGAEAFLILSQGKWPGLTCLNVSRNCMDAEGMALLVKGNWPRLARVTLSFEPAMDAAAISHLSAANWPLENLTILDTPFSIKMAAELADLQLPMLWELKLVDSGLSAAAVSELARADWPRLMELCIDHDDLDAVAVLLGADLGKVQELKSNASLDAVHQHRRLPSPAISLWPNLSWISVSHDNLYLLWRKAFGQLYEPPSVFNYLHVAS